MGFCCEIGLVHMYLQVTGLEKEFQVSSEAGVHLRYIDTNEGNLAKSRKLCKHNCPSTERCRTMIIDAQVTDKACIVWFTVPKYTTDFRSSLVGCQQHMSV